MMQTPDDRLAGLMAAALAGELTPDEAAEFHALRRTHPWIDAELAELRTVVDDPRLRNVTWTEASPDDALRRRIAAIGEADVAPSTSREWPPQVGRPSPRSAPRSHRRRTGAILGVAAASLVIGVGAGLLIPPALSTPVTGPPGTLGAIEQIDVRDTLQAVTIQAELVAHTWGTEAVLDATGLTTGASYSIVFVGSDGREFSAGAMLGSSVAIHCRVNAAVLREDVVRLEIRSADSEPVATAYLPEV